MAGDLMIAILDTDHFSALVAGGSLAQRLARRASECDADICISIITAQEVAQGWLAAINRAPAGIAQITGYARFQKALRDFQKITVLPFHAEAAAAFHRHRNERIRIGSMDLKIACVALTRNATLLTRNTVDFAQVPGLLSESWLD